MARIYKKSWESKPVEVNFNQKQWRQDLAFFLANKLYWIGARVSRSKTAEQNSDFLSVIKEFEIYDSSDNNCKVRYTNKNQIIDTNYSNEINEYLQFRLEKRK